MVDSVVNHGTAEIIDDQIANSVVDRFARVPQIPVEPPVGTEDELVC